MWCMPEAATGELSWGREGGGFSIFFQTFNLHIGFFNVVSSEKSLSILVFTIQRSPRTFAVVAQLLNWKAPKKIPSSFNWSKFWNRTKTLEEQQPNKNSSPKESNKSLFSIIKLFRQEASRHCCFNELARKLSTDPHICFLTWSCLCYTVVLEKKRGGYSWQSAERRGSPQLVGFYREE